MLSASYYKIPRFQRPYSWDKGNIQDFWEDVVRDNPGEYFIGSMVVYKDGQQRYGVVDGQQRLTTITILLSVIREAFQKAGFSDLSTGVQSLIERRNIDNKTEHILSTETAYPFFQDYIQKAGAPTLQVTFLKEESSLKAAHDQLSNLVDEAVKAIASDPTLSPEQHNNQLRTKLTSIRDSLLNLKIILIKLEDEDDAYLIFETLNTRGKDLSIADLVKNHLTKLIKAKNPALDEVKIKWKSILETIEGSNAELRTDSFIHHFWLSQYEYIAAKHLFKLLKKKVTSSNANQFLNALMRDATLYRTINEPGYRKWQKHEKRIESALEALTTFRVAQQTPCVLSILRAYTASKVLHKKHIEAALVAIEKFHFIFTAVTSQRSSGGISEMYAALGRRLFESNNTTEAVTVIQDLSQKLKDRIPSRDEFKALFSEIVYTDNITKQKKLVKYILSKIDQAQNTAAVIDYDLMTIEHLAPQSMIGTPGFTDEVVGQIGNLLLVPERLNGKLTNKNFKDKKKILQDSGYTLPPEIKDSASWTEKDIRARTIKLAEISYDNVWRL